MSAVIQKGDPDSVFKHAVVAIVERWRFSHPLEWDTFMDGQKMSRDGLYNETGMDKSGTIAIAARIPRQILESIDMLTGFGPTIEKDEKRWRWFREAFPQFFIARKKARN